MAISGKGFHHAVVVLCILLLAFLIWKIGPAELLQGLRTLSWGLAPLILMEGLSQLLNAEGWRHCLSGPLRSLPFLTVLRVHLIGNSLNHLTPMAGVGGEVAKGALLAGNRYGPEAASAVVIGKVAFALAHLLYVSLGILLVSRTVDLGTELFAAMLTGLALVGAGIIIFLLIQKHGKLEPFLRWVTRWGKGKNWLEKTTVHVRQVDTAMRLFYQESPGQLFLAVFWHMAGLACGILQTWFFLKIMTGSASITAAASISIFGSWVELVAFALPSDIGVLEGARVLFLKLLGFSAGLGLTYGVTIRLLQIFWASAGLLLYGTFFVRKREGQDRE